jgi:uncharacterized CHY-type Zn-finger protein
MNKVYKCCICHKKLKKKPIRLIKQEYGVGNYNQYAQVDKYDICQRCYTIFNAWLEKHREGK